MNILTFCYQLTGWSLWGCILRIPGGQVHAPFALVRMGLCNQGKNLVSVQCSTAKFLSKDQEQGQTVLSDSWVWVILTLQFLGRTWSQLVSKGPQLVFIRWVVWGPANSGCAEPLSWLAIKAVFQTDLVKRSLAKGHFEGVVFNLCFNHKKTKCNVWIFTVFIIFYFYKAW